MTDDRVAWPLRSVLSGAAGTATMTLAYAAERRLRHVVDRPLDYDDGLVPGQIVAGVMHLPHVTARKDHELGLLGAILAGPTAPATFVRRRLAPVLNEQAGIAWAIVAFAFLLLVIWGPTHALRTTWGLAVFAALIAGGVEALRHQTLSKFPTTPIPPVPKEA